MIKYEKPPIWDEITEHFPAVEWENVIVTYGENIYTAKPITHFKLIHESTHIKQQTDMGEDIWWAKYFVEEKFRLEQELEAYKNEVKEINRLVKNRDERYRLIRNIALDLSSEVYGNIISYEEAKKLLK